MDQRVGGLVGQRGCGRSVFAKSHAGLAKGDAVYFTMDSSGLLTKAIPNGQVGIVGVALHAVPSGDVGEFMIEGVCEALLSTIAIVAGHGVIPDNSLTYLKDAGGAFSGNVGDPALTHCGVVITAGTVGSNDSVIYLHGLPVLSVA
jgi:hypothetical protein